MKKSLLVLLVLFNFIIMGCSKGVLSGNKPPQVHLKVGTEIYEIELGTYC